jgi:hypothetical protein
MTDERKQTGDAEPTEKREKTKVEDLPADAKGKDVKGGGSKPGGSTDPLEGEQR